MISGRTAVYGLLGRPVHHSRSPALHNHWFAEHGLDAVYVGLPVPGGVDRGLGDALRALGLAGANLTVPFKEAIVPELDEVRGIAATLGAVNTVVVQGGRLVGHNTDADGFADGLRAAFGEVAAGARAVVLGAGGAGVAVAAGLAGAGASSILLLNRTPARAHAAVRRLRAAHPTVAFDTGALDAATFATGAADAAIVVQATSGPGADVVAGFDPTAVHPDAVWCDLNYWMGEPPLVHALVARGVRVQGGLPMLIHQAARAFSLFTGILPAPSSLPPEFG